MVDKNNQPIYISTKKINKINIYVPYSKPHDEDVHDQ